MEYMKEIAALFADWDNEVPWTTARVQKRFNIGYPKAAIILDLYNLIDGNGERFVTADAAKHGGRIF